MYFLLAQKMSRYMKFLSYLMKTGFLCKIKMGAEFSKFLRPIYYSCHELGHTWNPSCTGSTVEVGLKCFEEALKIYSAVYFVYNL
jgi:hypothetical protein